MTKTALLASLALFAAAPAYAFPPAGTPSTTPLNITANGQPASAVFVFKDAANTSTLNLTMPNFGQVFNNSTAAVGDVVDVGSPVGSVQFSLNNLSTNKLYFNNLADAGGAYHFYGTNDYSEFNVGALPAIIQTYISGLTPGTQYIFVGAEDKEASNGSDFDYNDIIYLFTQFRRTDVPAPSTIALFGLGLAAVGVARKRAR